MIFAIILLKANEILFSDSMLKKRNPIILNINI